MGTIQIQQSWLTHLEPEFEKDYMLQLKLFLQQQKQQRKVIFPPSSKWFEALNSTALDDVKVVIFGQDPYHGVGQAHGLCFSVLPETPVPPSLVNIYKELATDINMPIPNNGYLKSWAEQGVLLLNATLTVEMNKAGSHQRQDWETFTDVIISIINRHCDKVVFLLWGNYAQSKSALVNSQRHLILKAPHPSPLSAHRGFFGCRHFSQSNQFLLENNKQPINWNSVNV